MYIVYTYVYIYIYMYNNCNSNNNTSNTNNNNNDVARQVAATIYDLKAQEYEASGFLFTRVFSLSLSLYI